MQLSPYTYYRNTRERRAWLLADIDEKGTFNNGVPRVILIEWGKTRNQPTFLEMKAFETLVNAGKMQEFIPTVQA